MSKFSVGQSVLVGEAFKERKKSVHGVSFPSHLTATVVGDDGECLGPVIRLNCEGMGTPRDALGVWARADGWGANDGELTRLPLHRFAVNDKVTIKRSGKMGVVQRVFETSDRPYEVTEQYDENHAFIYFLSDDDLDPYVKPPVPTDDNDAIMASLTDDIAARFAKGRETYGHGVRVDDPYDWLTMVDEELLDALVYVRAEKLRRQRQATVDRQSRIDSHYIAVARELATMNGWTITNALDALVCAGFASAFYNDPETYLSDEPREWAKTVDQMRGGAK